MEDYFFFTQKFSSGIFSIVVLEWCSFVFFLVKGPTLACRRTGESGNEWGPAPGKVGLIISFFPQVDEFQYYCCWNVVMHWFGVFYHCFLFQFFSPATLCIFKNPPNKFQWLNRGVDTFDCQCLHPELFQDLGVGGFSGCPCGVDQRGGRGAESHRGSSAVRAGRAVFWVFFLNDHNLLHLILERTNYFWQKSVSINK